MRQSFARDQGAQTPEPIFFSYIEGFCENLPVGCSLRESISGIHQTCSYAAQSAFEGDSILIGRYDVGSHQSG